MNRHLDRRSLAAARTPAHPTPALPAPALPGADGRPEGAPSSEEAALALLADILLGEREWTLAEVRSLIALREATGRSDGSARGPDGAGGRAS
jgi:hypothetical protein